jgi:hypothetical protein
VSAFEKTGANSEPVCKMRTFNSKGATNCKHPIVAWGNGTGVTGSATYAAYHRRAATWGIVTIAAHNSNAGSMKFLEGGLDYLIAQNKESGSMFFGKLSDRAGVGGHSQGGIAATTATAHPNVQAEVCVQGGGFGVPKRVAFLCQTGVEDFLRGMCTSTYSSAAGPSFLLDTRWPITFLHRRSDSRPRKPAANTCEPRPPGIAVGLPTTRPRARSSRAA